MEKAKKGESKNYLPHDKRPIALKTSWIE